MSVVTNKPPPAAGAADVPAGARVTKWVLVRNVFFHYGGMLMGLAITVCMTPYLIHELGDVDYGVWTTVGALASWFGVLDLGVWGSLSRFVAKYNAAGAYAERNSIISSSAVAFCIAGGITLVATGVLMVGFGPALNIPEASRPTAVWVIAACGIGLAILFPAKLGEGILLGLHRYDITNSFTTVTALFNVGMIILYFETVGPNVIVLAAITNGVLVVRGLMLTFQAVRRLEHFHLSLKLVKWSAVREIMSLSLSQVLSELSRHIRSSIITLIIARAYGLETVTLIAPALLLWKTVRRLSVRGLAVMLPASSELQARGEDERLRMMAMFFARAALAFALLMCLGVWVFGKAFLVRWMGHRGADFGSTAGILSVLLISTPVAIAQISNRIVLQGTGKHWFVSWTTMAEIAAGVAMAILTLVFTDWGLYGVAASLPVPEIFVSLFVFPPVLCRHLKLPLAKYFVHVFVPPLICAVPSLAVMLAIKEWLVPADYWELAAAAAAGSAAFVIPAYWICVPRNYRSEVWSKLSRKAAGKRKRRQAGPGGGGGRDDSPMMTGEG